MIAVSVFADVALAQSVVTRREVDLSHHFRGQDACFVLWDVRRGEQMRYRDDRCAERLTPCSTFKIPHALIALEAGVLTGPEHPRKWDGQVTWNPAWNKDHTLRTAMSGSVFWYFQATAAELGEERMKAGLAKLGYGNQDITGGLRTFWLDNSLKVSADEQVAFLYDLQRKSLPFDPRNQRTVKELLVQPGVAAELGTVYAKTGTAGEPKADSATLGWYVGWLERAPGGEGDAKEVYIFAANVKGDFSGRSIRGIMPAILAELISE